VDIGPTKGLAKVPVKRICALGGEAIFSDKKCLKKGSRLGDPTWKQGPWFRGSENQHFVVPFVLDWHFCLICKPHAIVVWHLYRIVFFF
jgi:hypothetical protein